MLASLTVPAVKDFAELRTTKPGVTGSLQCSKSTDNLPV